MPTYISLCNWTDQGIRSVKDVPKRLEGGSGQAANCRPPASGAARPRAVALTGGSLAP